MASTVLGDGFSLDRSLQKEPHIILELSDKQAEQVGRFRRLELSPQQRALLRQESGKAPQVFGVESLGEPDCGCHVSSAFWMDDQRVVIWTDRLKYDRDGSRYYHEVRMERGRFVMDLRGQLYAAGKPMSLQEFERQMAAPRKARAYFQLSLPPNPPPKLERRLRQIQKKYHFNFRL